MTTPIEDRTVTQTGDVMTIGEVARAYDLTVRTLHHYDAIGLVEASDRSAAGYRLYTAADCRRLAAVVGYRRLGFSLEEAGRLLDGDEPLIEHLHRQRAAVRERLDELRTLVEALDAAVEAEMKDQMSEQELRDLFGGGFDDGYAQEAQERWGDTEAWRQGQERQAGYGRAEWEQIKAETDRVDEAFVAAMTAGEPADGTVAMDVAERHRRLIEEWFYDLDHAFHRSLGEMYVSDARFTAAYEQRAEGLAAYVHDAIAANAERHS